MADFGKPLDQIASTPVEARAPDPPKKCNAPFVMSPIDVDQRVRAEKVVDGLTFACDKAHSVLLAVVDAGVGQSRVRRVGALSEFTVGMGGPLKPHVVFVGWIARCPECFRDDQEAQYGR